MDTSIIKGIAISGIATVAFAVAAVGGCTEMSKPKFADVVAVKEITETITTPREECRDVQVQKKAPVKDSNRIVGTVLGGVAGALLGHQIGGGTGKTVATIAGGAGGAYAGNQVQDSMQKGDVVTTTRRDCKTVYDKVQKLIGYDVTYRLNDKEEVIRTSFRPGKTLPVENGKVVVTPPAVTQ
ncbi:MAG: glycine zipper 2TM domain-containing protein [Desulfuromonadaceae bacterium]|nr:glycine zipper 2TM domain-containing protein [Desulfuromonadaceae bacterium]